MTDTTAALKEATRSILQSLVAGDISPATLGTIERFCRAQKQALAEIDDKSALIGLSKGGMLDRDSGLVVSNGEYIPSQPLGALSPAPPAETLGQNTLRELLLPLQKALSRVGRPAPSVTDLTEAYSRAREADLPADVVAKLREALDTRLAEEKVEPAPPMLDATPKSELLDTPLDAGPLMTGLAVGLAAPEAVLTAFGGSHDEAAE